MRCESDLTILADLSNITMKNVQIQEISQSRTVVLLNSDAKITNVNISYSHEYEKMATTYPIFIHSDKTDKSLTIDSCMYTCLHGYYGKVLVSGTYACERCPSKTYLIEAGVITVSNNTAKIVPELCQECKPHTDCLGGNNVIPKNDTWLYVTTDDYSYYQCPPEYCNSSSSTTTAYTDIYCSAKRQGTLCATCTDDSHISLFSVECSETCDYDPFAYVKFTLIASIASLVITIYAFKDAILDVLCCRTDADVPSATIAILLFFAQTLKYIIIVGYINNTINHYIIPLSNGSQLDLFYVFPSICFQNLSFTSATFHKLAFSLLCMIFGFVFQLIRFVILYTRGDKDAVILSFRICNQHIQLLYFLMLTNSLELINCTNVNQSYMVLWRDASVKCLSDNWHIANLVVGLCTIYIMPFITPVSYCLFFQTRITYRQLILCMYLPLLLPIVYAINRFYYQGNVENTKIEREEIRKELLGALSSKYNDSDDVEELSSSVVPDSLAFVYTINKFYYHGNLENDNIECKEINRQLSESLSSKYKDSDGAVDSPRSVVPGVVFASLMQLFKCILVVFHVFIFSSQSDKYAAIAVLLLVYLCIILSVQPYNGLKDNGVLGGCLALLVYWSMSSYGYARVNDNIETNIFLTVVTFMQLILGSLGALGALIFLIITIKNKYEHIKGICCFIYQVLSHACRRSRNVCHSVWKSLCWFSMDMYALIYVGVIHAYEYVRDVIRRVKNAWGTFVNFVTCVKLKGSYNLNPQIPLEDIQS